jgi:hypothetical protein
MQHSLKSFAVGLASGLLTYAASSYTLGYTSAFVMPLGFPLALWGALVVFGLGASLVALLIHFLAIRTLAAQAIPALAGFVISVVLALLVTDQLTFGYRAIAAWLVGALLASATHSRLRSNNSFKPNPLRGFKTPSGSSGGSA